MNLEFIPQALKYVLEGPWANKRLRNREARLLVDGDEVATGPVLGLAANARIIAARYPDSAVNVVEHSCDSNSGI